MTAGDVYRYRSNNWDLLYVVLRPPSRKVHILMLYNANNSGYGINFKVGCVSSFDIDSPMYQESCEL